MMSVKINKNSLYLSVILIFTIVGINYAQIDSKQLIKSIEKSISNYYLESFDISTNNSGIITIQGDVSTLFDKLKIGELISQVDGVRGINNKIEVRVEPTPDNIIKENIEQELQLNNVILEPEKLMVDVKDGIVNISGTVSYLREKLMAQSIASWQDGVIDMTSSIKVLSPVAAKSDDNIKQIVSDIMQKYFSLEKNVQFDVNNGVVVLIGNVSSLYAKNHIQEEIQRLLGVKDVINQLTLKEI